MAPGVSAVQAALITPQGEKKGDVEIRKSPSFGSGSPAFHLAFVFVYSDDGGEEEVCGLVMNRESERKLLEKIENGYRWRFNQSGVIRNKKRGYGGWKKWEGLYGTLKNGRYIIIVKSLACC